MKQRFRYTIYFQDHSGAGVVEFDGEVYYYDHAEGCWRFGDEGGRELVAQGSDVAYFRIEPLPRTVGAASE